MLIAEVKMCSPFGYKASHSWEQLFEIAKEVGDVVSIHTDARWGGSFRLLEKACNSIDKPILAKGIHSTDEEIQQALDCGASYVLVVGRLPADVFLSRVLVEPNSLDELKSLDRSIKAIWNARDLTNGSIKAVSFEEARNNFSGWLGQASFIRSVKDIHEKADAAIVGTHLVEFAKTCAVPLVRSNKMDEDLRNTLLELLASLDKERKVWEPNGFISVSELEKWVKRDE